MADRSAFSADFRARIDALCTVLILVIGAGGVASGQDDQRRALLIGCSIYPDRPTIPALPGAANDVGDFKKLLGERFGFRQVQTLVGWPDAPHERPTKANIERAFEELIAGAAPGMQIFVLLSGHGTQAPLDEKADPLDPINPEPDGLDELFVPADGDPIVDDQFGRWFDALRATGASTWVVFDCCFSGTMSRDGLLPASAPPGERARVLIATELGVPADQLAAARARASKLEAAVGDDATSMMVTPAAGGQSTPGSLVVSYACQPFQKALERILPAGAAPADANRHGVMSYLLGQSLLNNCKRQTYRDLALELAGQFVAEVGSSPRSQTPWFEGDLDREVLGLAAWPERVPILLQTTSGGMVVRPGSLAGATAGSVLAVYSPDDLERSTVLAQIKVTRATAGSAAVEYSPMPGAKVATLAELPSGARCRVVSQQLGDKRIRVALEKTVPPQLQAALAAFQQQRTGLLELVTPEQSPAWMLLVRDPAAAKQQFGLQIPSDSLILLPADSATADSPRSPAVAHYPLSSGAELPQSLEADLRKIVCWQSLWAVAKEYAPPSEAEITLHVVRLGSQHVRDGESLNPVSIRTSDRLQASVRNFSLRRPYWYSVFFLAGNYGIMHLDSGQIRQRSGTEDFAKVDAHRMMITGDVGGNQGYVLVAIPQSQKAEPQLSFLAQTPLGMPDVVTRQPPPAGLLTPYERLLWDAKAARPLTRDPGQTIDEPSTAAFLWSLPIR